MLAFSNDYYGFIFRVTQSVELFCTYVPHAGGVAEHGAVPVVGFVEGQDVHAYHGQNCDEKQRGYRVVF